MPDGNLLCGALVAGPYAHGSSGVSGRAETGTDLFTNNRDLWFEAEPALDYSASMICALAGYASLQGPITNCDVRGPLSGRGAGLNLLSDGSSSIAAALGDIVESTPDMPTPAPVAAPVDTPVVAPLATPVVAPTPPNLIETVRAAMPDGTPAPDASMPPVPRLPRTPPPPVAPDVPDTGGAGCGDGGQPACAGDDLVGVLSCL